MKPEGPLSQQMIDVHTILLGDENPEWLAQMVQSLAGEPVSLHIVRGEFGHIGRGRAEGFSRGSNPYVAYVDPDDWVLPGAFSACLAALEADPKLDAAWSDYVLSTRRPFTNDLHHCVYRRSFVEGRLEEVRSEKLVPERALSRGARMVSAGVVGYVYRNRPDSPAKRLYDQTVRGTGTAQIDTDVLANDLVNGTPT